MTDTDHLRIAFIELSVFEDGAIRGGMLVTDEQTRPYEFRVTSAIKPTPMQKIMYGLTLKEYVYTDLIGLPLLKSAKETINLAFIRDLHLLSLRPRLGFPISHLQRASSTNDEKVQPVTSTAHKQFLSEETWINSIIARFSTQIDLLEPFERVKTALIEVHKQRPEEKRGEVSS